MAGFPVIPTLNPFAPKSTKTRWGEEAEMRVVEAAEILEGPDPTTWQDLSNRASALYLTGLTDEALEVAEKALAIERCVPTLVNAAVILETMGRFDEALEYAREATIVDPGDGRAHALYGEGLIRAGRLAEGWPLYCTQRADFGWMRDMGLVEWTGAHQPVKGKRILVIEGGGYGDNFYFLRWLEPLKRWGAHITYVCQPQFAALIRHLGYEAVENWAGNVDIRFDTYDYFTGLLSLACKFGVTFENYRWTGPYIRVTKRTGGSRTKDGRSMRVGLCSLAGEGTSPRKQRSLHDSQLKVIINALSRRHQWVNLIRGHKLPESVDHPRIENWLETARAVASCDLVVSVDTGVAHLAGAMEVPVWVMLPGASAWQYPIYRDDHPFYPSMRMFRNHSEGLDNAVEFCADALSAL